MNSRQKEILRTQLNNEEQTLKELKQVYSQALKDCESKIQELSMRADLEPENIQSIIYQKQYQEAIKAQLEGALANLQSNSYATVSDYLTRSYQEGYLGTMYDLQGRGIPLVMPIDQEQVAQAIQLNTKLSTSLYNRMGEDVNVLKKAVRQEVSRGIAQGMTWSQVASSLAGNMKHTPFQKAYNNSIRIARTEGHRIQNNATLDAQKNAKDRGADIVKRWNAVLDGKTRDVHRELDGQVREIGEMFEAAGYKVEAPGMFGDPSQDCNCRCYLEQVPRWDLEGGMTKMDNFSKRIVAFETPDDYEEWKKAYWSDENIAYMNYVTDMEKKYGKNFETVLNSMTDKEYERYKRLLDDNPMYKAKHLKASEKNNIDYTARRKERMAARNAERTKREMKPDFSAMSASEIRDYANNTLKTDFIGMEGANNDFIRSAVKVIDDFEQRNSGTIGGLKVKFGGTPSGVYAKYDDKTNTLLLKKTGDIKAFEQKQIEENLRYKLKWKKDKDYHATTSYSGTVAHELGHAVDSSTNQALSRALSSTNELDELSVKISSYAGTSQNVRVSKRSEAWAENFAAYMEGGQKAKEVPSEIAEMIEGYFKNKPLEKNGKSSTIKYDLQFFAEKTKHAEEREIERQVSEEAVKDALNNPLFKGNVIIDEQGRKSIKYIGREATVIMNPDTDTEITAWKTGTRIRKKYEGGD